MESVLSLDQELAVDKFMEFLTDPDISEMVLLGSPGSGKSFLTKYLVKMMRSDPEMMKLLMGDAWDYPVYFTATTNKAANVLQGMVNEPAKTIHSLLGLRVVNDFKTGAVKLIRGKDYRVISKSLIIIDEASMCNASLLAEIRASNIKCKILWIGDPLQLSPVKETSCPVFDIPYQAVLTTPHRQNEDSPIITISNMFKQAVDTDRFPKLTSIEQDVNLVNGAEFEAQIQKAYMNNIDAKVITWTNNRTNEYNAYIRNLLGHPEAYEAGEFLVANSPIIINGRIKCTTDQVVEITAAEPANLHNIPGANLEINGEYTIFLPDNYAQAQKIIKAYAKVKDWKKHFYYKEAFCDLRPPYASTIFKVQGATHHTVFVDINDISRSTHNNQIARMLHVGFSRPTHKLYMHGSLPKRLYAQSKS